MVHTCRHMFTYMWVQSALLATAVLLEWFALHLEIVDREEWQASKSTLLPLHTPPTVPYLICPIF